MITNRKDFLNLRSIILETPYDIVYTKTKEYVNNLEHNYININIAKTFNTETIVNVDMVSDLHLDQNKLYTTDLLTLAVYRGNLDLVKYMVYFGTCTDQDIYMDYKWVSNNKDLNPICVACYLGYWDVLSLLLEEGYNPNMFNNFYPLEMAIRDRNFKIVKLLISYGANPRRYINDQHMILHDVSRYITDVNILNLIHFPYMNVS